MLIWWNTRCLTLMKGSGIECSTDATISALAHRTDGHKRNHVQLIDQLDELKRLRDGDE